ncbi:protein MALE DISCOVERER 2-like [Beta vulgaris subsp. vulgaris]|uniref:protein MALE DISCOVERER 2-like n=1 Tax=Beta vulgaris subsp. vulgaris TaxID=3555 RepID=UPI002036C243|nr:protein MALE DISCOVERER 2-like [Beta vulgaris subsp. vulgaris]
MNHPLVAANAVQLDQQKEKKKKDHKERNAVQLRPPPMTGVWSEGEFIEVLDKDGYYCNWVFDSQHHITVEKSSVRARQEWKDNDSFLVDKKVSYQSVALSKSLKRSSPDYASADKAYSKCVQKRRLVDKEVDLDAIPDRLLSHSSAGCSQDHSVSLSSDAEPYSHDLGEEEVSSAQFQRGDALEAHKLDLYGYRCVLELLYSSGPLSWRQEIALTDLRLKLSVSNDEHLTELRRLKSGRNLVLSEIRECESLNPEGLALLEFRERIENDPYGAFANWNPNHSEPCLWLGVHCLDGKVQMLDLNGFSLRGTLAPALKKLRYLRSLMMSNNRLSGSIPKEIGELKLLEVLDLTHNNLSGTIPSEIGEMPSLRCMSLCGNGLDGDIPLAIGMLDSLPKSQCSHRIKSFIIGSKYYIQRTGHCLGTKPQKCCFYAEGNNCCHNISRDEAKDNGRRYLSGESINIAAAPAKSTKVSQQSSPNVLKSGSYPVLLKTLNKPAQPSSSSTSHEHPKADGFRVKVIMFVVVTIAAVFILCFALIAIRRYRGTKVTRAQNAALLQRLSKVFVTGVPKLNSTELQTACEDFSNIIDTFSGCLMYKGILSSGVEIAVLSTSIRSSRQWSNCAESEFKRKMDTFSKINHKNFVNLLGYCEEDNPFVRMMVFEYAPNGNLYEHLHVKDMNHLDWTTRMRIIMGTCYCLEHMHHELNPPVIHPNLQSDAILLTDDYAAKLADVAFWADIVAKAKISDDEESEPLHSNPGPTCEDNVYSLGILLLEIISTKSLSVQAMEYLSDKEKYINLIDPTLKSSKNNELEIICDVIRECIDEDPRRRPTLKEITSKLQTVIKISPDAATARHSPLWWAELELMDECG